MAKEFTIHLKEPTFHEESEAEQQARIDRIVAIIRHELPNILISGELRNPEGT